MELLYPTYFKCVRFKLSENYKRVPIRRKVYPFVFMGRNFLAHKCESGMTWEIRDQRSGMVVVEGLKRCYKTKKEAMAEFDKIMVNKTQPQIKQAFDFADEQIKTVTEVFVPVEIFNN